MHSLPCSNASYQDTLKNILNFAQSIRSSRKLETPRTDAIIPLPVLSLPIHEGITSSLLHSVECSPSVASALSTVFIDSALKIRAAHESAFRDIAQHLASDPGRLSDRLKNTGTLLEKQYYKHLRVAEQLVVDQAQQQHRSAKDAKSRPVFNQEFVPLLEKYFEYNAYPSGPDRAALARKSMMTPRQIEVWFQNHRNRARKEGKALRKLASNPLPVHLSFESLKEKTSFERKERPVDVSYSQSDDDSEDELQVLAQPFEKDTHAAFTLNIPSHAFPMVYPPSCSCDPFPPKDGNSKFPAPVWTRVPATSRPGRKIVNFDDFVTDFAVKLVIRDNAPSQKQSRKSLTMAERRPWFLATHTIASPAPHPAFIRSTNPLPMMSKPLTPLPSVSTPSCRRHPFRSPTPGSSLLSLMSSVEGNTSTRRMVARLPKRTPRNENMAHRAGSPATSTGSPSPSSSRTSSLSSIGSSNRRPSSSSSSSSSGPSTPPSSPTSHDDTQLPYVSESQWDFQRRGGLFGDFVDPVSPVSLRL